VFRCEIVLDLPRTREWLETHGVSVLGYQCDELPAFYSRKSGLPIDERVDTVEEVASIAYARDILELQNAILLTVPVPKIDEVAADLLDKILQESLQLADEQGISGKDVTPFLLSQMSKKSEGQTIKANIALLENNAKIAAQVAVKLKK
jgi:pseudouridylate synthase